MEELEVVVFKDSIGDGGVESNGGQVMDDGVPRMIDSLPDHMAAYQ